MIHFIYQATQTAQPIPTPFDPWRWIGFVVGVIGVLFTAITITLTHIMWVWVWPLKNEVDTRPKEGHRRYLKLKLRNLCAEIPDLSVAMVFVKDGVSDEKPLVCMGDCPNPFKRNVSRNFYAENPDPRRSLEAENMTDIWIEVRSGVIPIKTLRGKRYRPIIDAWSRQDPSLPPPPEPPPPGRYATFGGDRKW
jgi:hypothetical protein